MARFIMVLIFSAIGGVISGQTVAPISKAAEHRINIAYLDSIYPSGAHADTSMAVFGDQLGEYFREYQVFLFELGKFLKTHDFTWEKPTRGFNRVYFDKDGKIDYFLFSFLPDQITQEQEKQFEELLKVFVLQYRFPMTAQTGFSQCSPVTYLPFINE